jgi:SPP1 family predicted phage head-tail adaptor
MREPLTGELNRRISIKSWQDMPAMGGGVTQNLPEIGKAWAKIEPVGTAIYFGTQQTGEQVTHRIIYRMRTGMTERDVTAEHVVDYATYRYRVMRASNMNDSDRFVLLEVKELGHV